MCGHGHCYGVSTKYTINLSNKTLRYLHSVPTLQLLLNCLSFVALYLVMLRIVFLYKVGKQVSQVYEDSSFL